MGLKSYAVGLWPKVRLRGHKRLAVRYISLSAQADLSASAPIAEQFITTAFGIATAFGSSSTSAMKVAVA